MCFVEITVEKRKVTLCNSAMTCKGNCGNATMAWCVDATTDVIFITIAVMTSPRNAVKKG